MNGMGWWFESLDQIRKLQGYALQSVGLGALESPYRRIFSRPGVHLRLYEQGNSGGPVLLIVPAPIKGPYIWDLSPQRSVVRRAIDQGFQVYLVEWAEPEGAETRFGLAEFAGVLLQECIAAIAERAGSEKVWLAGHSLGGTLAVLYAAQHPEQVNGLVLIEAPLHFAEASGAFKPLLDSGVPSNSAVPLSGRVPGSLLGLIAASAAPDAFSIERYGDYLASLGSPEDLQTHWRVVRWTLDELPLPRGLFEEVVEQLYRGDRFMRGELTLNGTRLHPRNVTPPLFAVYDPSSRVIPPASVIAFFRAAASQEKELVPYPGDTGVALQHVGALVGDTAHRQIWPRVFDWLERIRVR